MISTYRIPYAVAQSAAPVIGLSVVRVYLRLRNGGNRASEALELARARVAADYAGASFDWDHDYDGCSGCECGSEKCHCHTGTPHETEYCRVTLNGHTLASLSGICEADSAYRYQVECELALEADDQIRDYASESDDTSGV